MSSEEVPLLLAGKAEAPTTTTEHLQVAQVAQRPNSECLLVVRSTSDGKLVE